MRKSLIFSLLFITIVAGAGADNGTEEEQQAVQNFVEGLASEVIQIVNDEGMTQEEKLVQLETFFTPHFDFPFMARFTLRRYWGSMTEREKEEYTSLLRQRIVHQYMTQLLGLKITDWDIRQVNIDKQETKYVVRVNTAVNQNTEYSLDIQWVLIGTDIQALKCIDVSIDGIPLLINLRQDLRNLLKEEKNNIARFLRTLADEIQENF